MIPRATVAEALGVNEDALPPGDLPVDRFAERFQGALASEDDMDVWTIDLFHHLVTAAPDLALATLLACLDRAPDQARSLGEGPLTDLLTRSGADVMSAIEAARRPALTDALQAVDTGQIDHPFLLARIDAARA